METYLIAGRFPTQSLRSSPRSSAFSNSRNASLFHGTVCNFQPEMEKKTLNINRMFILGMGFVGQYFAHELKRHGWEISETCSTVAKKMKLEEMGFDPSLFNASDPESLNPLQDSSHLLISIPPIDGLCDPIGAFSASGHYKKNTRQRNCSMDGLFMINNALDTIIKHETFSKSQKMRESRNYTSRVHVADICQVLIASMVLPSSSSGVYNVVDNDPAPGAEVFAFAQTLNQERWPGHVMECLSLNRSDVAIEEENVKTGKRVFNALLKQELGMSLLHPTFRSGLQSIAETMGTIYGLGKCTQNKWKIHHVSRCWFSHVNAFYGALAQ